MGKKILVSWLGITDLKAANLMDIRPEEAIGHGPILGALKTLCFDELHLLFDQKQAIAQAYSEWLVEKHNIKTVLVKAKLRTPIDFGDIYHALDKHLQTIVETNPTIDISLHLSPGTPSMAAVSILLGKNQIQRALRSIHKRERRRICKYSFRYFRRIYSAVSQAGR